GRIVDLNCAGDESFLSCTLGASEALRDKDRKRARKHAQSNGGDYGEAILELGLLPDEEISERLLGGVQEQLAEILSLEQLTLESQAGPLSEPFGVGRVLQINLSVDEMMIGAARLVDDWQLIADHLPALKDVYYATPQSFGYVQAHEEYPNEIAMVNVVDGERDLRDSIASSGIDPFVGLSTVQALHAEGALALINPVQLFQQGCDLSRAGDTERALRRLQRAEERGLDDFDLGFKLGELYETTDQVDRAIECYLAFAEKCATQFRIEDTIRACSRIIEIDPDNVAIQDRYLSLLAKYAKPEEAIGHGLRLARRFAENGRDSQARAALEQVLDGAEANEEVLRFYLDLCEKTGHDSGANQARRRLGDLFHQREELDKALELYQNLYVQGEATAEVRARLAEMHSLRGNLDAARDHLIALRRYDGWAPQKASPDALDFYRRLDAIENIDPAVPGWLVEEAKTRNHRDDLVSALRRSYERLVDTDQVKEALRAAEQLVELCPMDLEAARTAARMKRESGDRIGAAATLEKALESIDEESVDPELHRALLEELVQASPLSLRGRVALLSATQDVEDDPTRERLRIETGMLELLVGDTSAAIQRVSETSTDSNGLSLYFAYLAGRVCQLKGDQPAALECYHRCADAATLRKDKSLLGDVLLALEGLTPGDPEVERYREKFEHLEVIDDPGRSTERVVAGSPLQGITAKLKNVQSNDSTEPTVEAVAPPAPSSSAGPLSAVARLKALKSGDSTAPTGDAPAEASITTPDESASAAAPPPPPTSKKLKGADRLKALRGAGSDEPVADEAAPVAPDPVEPAEARAAVKHPKPKRSKAKGAASKLSALRSGDDSDH
ncbi:MAG: hypothetical protein AAF488_16670, partial [Planctomycetota bacterium]